MVSVQEHCGIPERMGLTISQIVSACEPAEVGPVTVVAGEEGVGEEGVEGEGVEGVDGVEGVEGEGVEGVDGVDGVEVVEDGVGVLAGAQ